MVKKNDSRTSRKAIWLSSILRWAIGIVFLTLGFIFRKEDDPWILFLFGTVLFVSGFFRPRRCIDDQCNV